jgi:hypothetical protein
MLHAIAIATAFFIRFELEALTKVFIRDVLDELAIVGNPLGLRAPSPCGIGRQVWRASE